ncbi:hypothetical protein EU803_15995 [Loktanella sp. IMCC34160]|uniref:hypothetical protein n=1 Tax=Loktanella sp. IMCC34160 TaxID=2510646 RepID=UPI00101C9A5B|nr:hypothetical protein [Loktanella sp. IMCC34160]RYG89656.1 hypothetical protein EU803_15995 [Loktanella sp. IMCC34160]
MTDLMHMLAASGSQAPNDLIQSLINSGRISGERAQLLEMMMAQQAGDESEVIDAEPATEPPHHAAPLDHRIEALLTQSADRIDYLERLTHRLGLALGACPECFGQDTDCPECRGRGRPGDMRPDRREFTTFVLPVLSRMRRSPEKRTARLQPTPHGAAD